MSEIKSIKEVKCKRCGGNNFALLVSTQNNIMYKVLSNGKLSKKYTIQRDMPMDIENLICTDCGELIDYWNIDKDGNVEVEE